MHLYSLLDDNLFLLCFKQDVDCSLIEADGHTGWAISNWKIKIFRYLFTLMIKNWMKISSH